MLLPHPIPTKQIRRYLGKFAWTHLYLEGDHPNYKPNLKSEKGITYIGIIYDETEAILSSWVWKEFIQPMYKNLKRL